MGGKLVKHTVSNNIELILQEIHSVLQATDNQQVNTLVKEIMKSQKIVTIGAGRMGMTARAFAMRLKHLGMDAYSLGDSNVPNLGKNELLVVASGSGETQTIFDIASIAKKSKVKIALVTGKPKSRIGKLADHIVQIKAPTKFDLTGQLTSIQPMTTLFEQSTLIFFDAVVLILMEKTKQTLHELWKRHSRLE